MNRELICICCPRGCRLHAEVENGEVLEVTGNFCKRGKDYAVSEITAPVRMVTTTIRTAEGASIPVKTREPIPKEKIFGCMQEIKAAEVHIPVRMGDVLLPDVAGTGIPVIAARSIPTDQ